MRCSPSIAVPIATGLLFNPIIPVHLSRSTWLWLDLAAVVLFVGHMLWVRDKVQVGGGSQGYPFLGWISRIPLSEERPMPEVSDEAEAKRHVVMALWMVVQQTITVARLRLDGDDTRWRTLLF